ncbi:MAG: hypothetical protein NZ455_02830 [Bacteroidia bacterium]|nr:hypothetical protein [Bacteroidia bacterium]MDW8346765.1 hypothetical protein [Bacteroidia bacterium]
MREACGGQAVRLGAKPLAHTLTLAQGVGAAPLARSTPTFVEYMHSETPTRKRPKNNINLTLFIPSP